MGSSKTSVSIPNQSVSNISLDSPNLASTFHKSLCEMIVKFEKNLDPEDEVGVKLVSFGQSITFHVTDIGFKNPSLIIFIGKLENGTPVELIQNVSQINFLLMAVKPLNDEKPKRLVGFLTENSK